mgnify:CR=1 FL=1
MENLIASIQDLLATTFAGMSALGVVLLTWIILLIAGDQR